MYNSLLMLIGEYLTTRSDHLWCKLPGFLSNYFILKILEQKLPIRFIEQEYRNRNLPKNFLWLYQNYLEKLTDLQEDFHWCCHEGHLEIFKLLLQDQRVDPSIDHNHAITCACSQGYIEIVKLLLQDQRIDPSDYNNRTIIWVCHDGHLEIARLLLQDNRVDPSDLGNLAIRWASKYGNLEVVRLLLQDHRVDSSDDDNDAIKWANEKGHINVVKLLLTDQRVRKLIEQDPDDYNSQIRKLLQKTKK